MPQADGASGSTKEAPIDVTNTDLKDEELGPQEEDIRGNGASGSFSNPEAGDIKAGDTEKSGAKSGDAMGAGA